MTPRGPKVATHPDVAAAFLRWTLLRAVFHRGYVLVSSLYFVIGAHLSASQLEVLALTVGLTLLVSDIPTGVWSDTISRKWPLVIGHAFLASGMFMTGVVTSFPLLIVTQVLWGIGWGFSSGADVAWITDELDQPNRIDRVLTARARWELIGGAAGMVLFGLLAWATSLAFSTVSSGIAMALAGLYVVLTFSEDHFVRVERQRFHELVAVLERGIGLSRRNSQIMLMLTATLVLNAASVVTWLFPKQLINLGFPSDPILWYSALGVLSSLLGAVVLRGVEGRIHGVGVARRAYVIASVAGVCGLVLLAGAPEALIGCVGVLVMRGIALNVTRAVSVIWVNRRVTSDVRATVHSFLGQAESVGEILGGVGLALVAQSGGIAITLISSAALIAVAALLVARSRRTDPLVPALRS
ncbi:MAG: MFS transporter [Nitrolancea sp.]